MYIKWILEKRSTARNTAIKYMSSSESATEHLSYKPTYTRNRSSLQNPLTNMKKAYKIKSHHYCAWVEEHEKDQGRASVLSPWEPGWLLQKSQTNTESRPCSTLRRKAKKSTNLLPADLARGKKIPHSWKAGELHNTYSICRVHRGFNGNNNGYSYPMSKYGQLQKIVEKKPHTFVVYKKVLLFAYSHFWYFCDLGERTSIFEVNKTGEIFISVAGLHAYNN